MRTPYADLDEDGQIEVLRGVAAAGAERFGLEVEALALVLHAFNTTFRVDGPDGRRTALRVGTNSHSTREHVAAQQAWVRAIATDTDVRVPSPVAAPDGALVAAVPCPEMGRDLLVVANSWLEGDDVGVCDVEQARALGTAMATLHRHARTFEMPPGAALPVFADPLFGDRDVLTDAAGRVVGGRAVVAEAMRRCTAAFDALAGEPAIPLHADLHGGNLKWHEGRLAVFDFDDAGLAPAVLDLAIAAFYLRLGGDADPGDRGRAEERALHDAYAALAPLPRGVEHLEALIASRQLLLANDLLGTSTASMRTMAEEYLGTSVRRLDAWLRTGRFGPVPDPS